jgi:hypothetical protein
VTTAEHPFFSVERGWVKVQELAVGETLVGQDGQWTNVASVRNTNEWRTVYNVTVAEHHTYFVGKDEWGFSVWVHNARYSPLQQLARSDEQARKSLRRALKARFGDIAHHIVALRDKYHPLIVEAARRGFNINGKENGVLLNALQHSGGHPKYLQAMRKKMGNIVERNGGVNDRSIAEWLKYVEYLKLILPKTHRIV